MVSHAKPGDTIYVENKMDIRYLRYLDSLQAYRISYSVAKNISDSIRVMLGNNSLDAYFLNGFAINPDTLSTAYYYDLHEKEKVDIGHISDTYKGLKDDGKIPWTYLVSQYKRLDSIKIHPSFIMQGGELPNVYVYIKPRMVVIHRVVRRFTVVGQIIKFSYSADGKTKTPYIEKYYYAEFEKGHVIVDSIEKLDPIHHLPFVPK